MKLTSLKRCCVHIQSLRPLGAEGVVAEWAICTLEFLLMFCNGTPGVFFHLFPFQFPLALSVGAST